jgi:quinol monooxygenase YgiN
MPDLIIVARVLAKPGHEAALVAAQIAFVDIARQQPGCHLYDLHESEDQAGSVLFFERWRDRAAWDAHMGGAHMEAFRAQTADWIETVELLRMRQVA